MLDITCSQSELSFALNTVSRAINNTNTLPILNNILLEAKDETLHFSATNLEIAIKTHIKAKVKESDGITIPAKLLTSYVQLLNDNEITVTTTRDFNLEISSKSDYTKIKGIKAEDFPSIPTIDAQMTVQISAKNLHDALQLTHFAASIHSSRPVLSGVLLHFQDETLTSVATDSYRLAEKRTALKSKTQEFTAIIPVRTAIEVMKIFGSDPKEIVQIRASKNQIEFATEKSTLVSRLIEGVFPDYKKIIPREQKTVVSLPTSDLMLGIKKISLFAREINNNMKLATKDKVLTLSTEETKVGEGEISLPIKQEGPDNQIAVNVQYLSDVLTVVNQQETEIIINEKLSPLIVKPAKSTDYIYIIMPLKA